MKKGRFITFEGMDGAGKSTQVSHFNKWLQEKNINTHVVREPGGTPFGEEVRQLLLSSSGLDAKTETLLLFASRCELLKQQILPLINQGIWVISDRFTDSTFAYQGGGRQLSDDFIQALANIIHADLNPDLTFYIDSLPALSAGRSNETFESESSVFFERVQQRYYGLCDQYPNRIQKINGFDGQVQYSVNFIQTKIQAITTAKFGTDLMDE